MSRFNYVVFGGQFGSEGKGCVAEWLINNHHDLNRPLIVCGENAPNSGHTNSRGKTRSLPVSAYYATAVLLGPDAAVDPELLLREVDEIRSKGNRDLLVYVHENAALITANMVENEKSSSLVARVASTATGGGAARTTKAFQRHRNFTMHHAAHLGQGRFEVVGMTKWFELCNAWEDADWLVECSQGFMLDLNLGYFPHVTSRTTHPRAVVERNGWGVVPGGDKWRYVGTYRTFPIRTGGSSGPTGGQELSWESIKVPAEIATVTKRTRRVFEFSGSDFLYSCTQTRPDAIAFTHLDYLPEAYRHIDGFKDWLGREVGVGNALWVHPQFIRCGLLTSDAPGLFQWHGRPWASKPVTVSQTVEEAP